MKHKGFTFAEVLVVLAIIGLLSTIAVVTLRPMTGKVKDNRRLKDVDNIRAALNLYKQETGFYPPSLPVGQPLVGPSGQVYLDQVPANASDNSCQSEYTYTQKNNGFAYDLRYCLTTKVDTFGPGNCLATPGSLCCQSSCSGKCGGDDGCGSTCTNTCGGATPYCSNDNQNCIGYPECPADVCGDCRSVVCGNNCTTTVKRNGVSVAEVYGTVQVNGQCWLTKNINVGTMVNGGVFSDDNQVERWCYSNTASYCDTDGALYAWNEAMYLPKSFASSSFSSYGGSGAAAKRQGLCPVGWHVPSDAEIYTLENYLDSYVSGEVIGSSVYYADQFGTGGTTGNRGLASSWSAGIGAKLLCTAQYKQSWKNTPSYCTEASYPATAPKLPLAGSYFSNSFNYRSSYAYWWSSSQYSTAGTAAWFRSVMSASTQSSRNQNAKINGATLRCLKD